ncbi:PDGLE domain-containing protein [Microbacterium sp. K24]|uniref:PDGLE domain-containing protein n=1 Tax=Microbacterium sp. K24 TaxID=2305446 RepID=UPI00109C853F|nr:PDGLE domain-containing protein [Microbacterium sp. K24]
MNASTLSKVGTGVVFAAALVVACVLSTWASGAPDGLEHVAETLGFADTARPSVFIPTPLSGYTISAIPAALSTAVVGLVGCGTVFGLGWSASAVVKAFHARRGLRRQTRENTSAR